MLLGLLMLIAFAACVTFVVATVYSITKPRRIAIQRFARTNDPRPMED